MGNREGIVDDDRGIGLARRDQAKGGPARIPHACRTEERAGKGRKVGGPTALNRESDPDSDAPVAAPVCGIPNYVSPDPRIHLVNVRHRNLRCRITRCPARATRNGSSHWSAKGCAVRGTVQPHSARVPRARGVRSPWSSGNVAGRARSKRAPAARSRRRARRVVLRRVPTGSNSTTQCFEAGRLRGAPRGPARAVRRRPAWL